MPSGKIFRNLTIYQRVEFLIGISLISLGALLVLFINAIAPLLVTSEVGVPNSVVLINTTNTYGTPITIMEETPAPSGFTISHNLNAIKTDPLLIVRVLSILGLVMIIGIGFFTSRWIAKISIKPIGQISQKAQKIDAKSLDQRINYLGP